MEAVPVDVLFLMAERAEDPWAIFDLMSTCKKFAPMRFSERLWRFLLQRLAPRVYSQKLRTKEGNFLDGAKKHLELRRSWRENRFRHRTLAVMDAWIVHSSADLFYLRDKETEITRMLDPSTNEATPIFTDDTDPWSTFLSDG